MLTSEEYSTLREFQMYLLEYFQDNPKTTWGKNELQLKIRDIFNQYVDLIMKKKN